MIVHWTVMNCFILISTSTLTQHVFLDCLYSHFLPYMIFSLILNFLSSYFVFSCNVFNCTNLNNAQLFIQTFSCVCLLHLSVKLKQSYCKHVFQLFCLIFHSADIILFPRRWTSLFKLRCLSLLSPCSYMGIYFRWRLIFHVEPALHYLYPLFHLQHSASGLIPFPCSN
jgi:hypothetical protein